nr:immunoglobulin light chain junction region [Macaca mulatta]MOY14830.1 immunoglobulin light chain junction region [Macaca mulatta]MOY15836.1 immunoglobulin light chain junction region [Macaca mulatta]MOY15923.1 immunoglobulin light chain junction region [Macaca mulatta]MOY16260.1 immunoglobulin light chain junction region [Macaca mulatta]
EYYCQSFDSSGYVLF